ncbi:MAG TPA: Stp1/IreP family PP2C-type Ser/Thr phosphatase [Polyangiaceae bacterium]|nr:Stp1/IreP family PP2C-type Ser/Thr phosphatase [Polyangiaceae bacterium]
MSPPPSRTAGASSPGLGAPAGPPVRVRLFGRTDVGQVREHNEDNFLIADLSARNRALPEGERTTVGVGPRGTLFAVCDGMGGAAAGEVASQLAVDILFERMVEGDPPKDHDELARRLVRAIEAAGARIYQEAKADRTRRGMGTTSTVASLVDDHLFLGQVGDSRGYILRGDRFVQVTRDQSLVNQLIEAGQLTEEEAETFEHNNIILQALGTSDTVQVDLTFVELRRGDVLLLCSDGLSGMVRHEEVRDILRSYEDPFEACQVLTDRANQAGGHDNITCIVARFEGEALKPPGEGDELKYRKYALPEEPIDNGQTQRIVFHPLTVERPTDHGPSASKVADTMLSINVADFADQLREAANAGAANRPPHHRDEPVDLPLASTPPWLVGLFVAFALGFVAFMGFYLLR